VLCAVGRKCGNQQRLGFRRFASSGFGGRYSTLYSRSSVPVCSFSARRVRIMACSSETCSSSRAFAVACCVIVLREVRRESAVLAWFFSVASRVLRTSESAAAYCAALRAISREGEPGFCQYKNGFFFSPTPNLSPLRHTHSQNQGGRRKELAQSCRCGGDDPTHALPSRRRAVTQPSQLEAPPARGHATKCPVSPGAPCLYKNVFAYTGN
jgi:hypothetical protein